MKPRIGKIFAVTPKDSGFPQACLITYENDGAPIIGAVLGFKKDKYQILNDRSREVDLSPVRLHRIPGSLSEETNTTEAKVTFLQNLRVKAEHEADQINMEELWQVVAQDEREYSNTELCELYYTDNSSIHHLAIRLALIQDNIFFKRGKDSFIPRSLETVAQLKKAEAVHQEKLRFRELVIETLTTKLKDPSYFLPEIVTPTLNLLEDIAAGASHVDNHRHKEAKELLDLCTERLNLPLGGNKEQRALTLLSLLHHIGPHTNIAFFRYRPPNIFSTAVLEEAARIEIKTEAETQSLPSPLSTSIRQRIDLSHLPAFTIDDASTKDMDDALSLEILPKGYRLGIHISDVASLLSRNSLLDREAKERATSLYLPEKRIPMLPEILSEEKLSLRANQVRTSISCIFEVDSSLRVSGGTICPSLIQVKQRYTYEEVDLLLEKDQGELNTIYNIACRLDEERLRKGAIKVYKPDLLVSVDKDGIVQIREIDEHGPARSLIGEMMVLANTLLARYAASQNLPAIFRQQDPPDETEGKSEDAEKSPPPGPAQDYVQRAKLKKSLVSLRPGPHSSLGVEAYLQATSPIRRYIDLCNQRQILHHVQHEKIFYSPKELTQIIQETEETLGSAQSLTKESRRFWLLRYLEQRLAKKTIDNRPANLIRGTVLRTDLKNPLVELEEVFLPIIVKFNQIPKRGELLELKIVAVDANTDYLRVERA